MLIWYVKMSFLLEIIWFSFNTQVLFLLNNFNMQVKHNASEFSIMKNKYGKLEHKEGNIAFSFS